LDKDSALEFDKLVAAKAEGRGKLDLVDRLGKAGENYSQDIVELGLTLMATRLTAPQAVAVVRAFVQLEHPDKEEGKDYRIPDEKRFREWRNYLGPICHYLGVRVINIAERTHGAHDATNKNNMEIFNTSFVCELKSRTGGVVIANVPVQFTVCSSTKAKAESELIKESLHTDLGGGQHVTLLKCASMTSDNSARATSAEAEERAKEEAEEVRGRIAAHLTENPEHLQDAVKAFPPTASTRHHPSSAKAPPGLCLTLFEPLTLPPPPLLSHSTSSTFIASLTPSQTFCS
jgi:hypothetical protein